MSKVSRWTRIYAWLDNLATPQWFVDLTDWLTLNVVNPALKAFAKAEIDFMRNQIIRAARNKDWSSQDKFEHVRGSLYESYERTKELPSSMVNLAIELLVSAEKQKGNA